MSTQPLGDQRPSSEPSDEIDELFGGANPNPNRVGCPPTDVLEAMAHRVLPIGDPAYQHLSQCSPCYEHVRGIQNAVQIPTAAATAPRLRRSLLAALVILAVSASIWFVTSERPANAVVELDLRPYALARSEAQRPAQPPLSVPRAIVMLTLILPAGSEPGAYDIGFVGTAGERPLGTGEAIMREYATVLELELDLRAFSAGRHQLRVIGPGASSNVFPVVLE